MPVYQGFAKLAEAKAYLQAKHVRAATIDAAVAAFNGGGGAPHSGSSSAASGGAGSSRSSSATNVGRMPHSAGIVAAAAATPSIMQLHNDAARAAGRAFGKGVRSGFATSASILATRATGWEFYEGKSDGGKRAASTTTTSSAPHAKKPRWDETIFDDLGADEREEARIEAAVSDIIDDGTAAFAGLPSDGSPPPAPGAAASAGAGAGAGASASASTSTTSGEGAIRDGEERYTVLEPPDAANGGSWGASDEEATMMFDGGARNNPGPAGAGAVIYIGSTEVGSVVVPLGKGTNNQAEYVGMISGMRLARRIGISTLHVKGDSKLCINQVRGKWQVNSPNIQGLGAYAKKEHKKFAKCTFDHVYRDSNKRADALSNVAMDAINTRTPQVFDQTSWLQGLDAV